MDINEAYVEGQAPNAAAVKNARGVVAKRKLAGLFHTADGTLLFGECQGSGAENYRPSADFSDPGKPVYRCTCPSRQFPCKHALALLLARAQGAAFSVAEAPADIVEKREKLRGRVEKKREEPERPAKVDTGALAKKIRAQLEGLDLLEGLVGDLARAGLGALNAKSAREIEERAKQLGNAYLPGAQRALHGLTGLFRRSEGGADLEEGEREGVYGAALDQLNRLRALCGQGRAYLGRRLEDPGLKPETETEIAAWLGHAWQLRELREAGLTRAGAELLQLAFYAHDDWARGEFVETGVWINLADGLNPLTRNYRPHRAARHIREEDSCDEVVVCGELCVYPGGMNPRVRWESAERRVATAADFARAREWARPEFAPLLKEVRGQLKSPLRERNPCGLARYRALGRVGEEFVIEDATGERLALGEDPRGEGPPTLGTLCALPARALREQVMLARFHHNFETQKLRAKPLAIVLADRVLRLTH